MRRSGRSRARGRSGGFSLLELLVALTMVGVALSAALAFGSTSLKLMRQNQLRLEVKQALRTTGDAIVRDMRLAAACLPQNGSFVALDGTDTGLADAITIRTGFSEDNLACIATTVNVLHVGGSDSISVDDAGGFGQARLGYIRHLDGDGEFFTIADVDPVGGTITRGNGASRDFPVGSGVFAVDERTYALDTSGSGPPVLTLEVDRQGAEPFAAGIREFQIRYILERNCPPCDVVDLPLDDQEWWLVNQVAVTVKAETVNPVRAEDSYAEARTVVGKPRNLLP
jgi:prepilin-type N-terminal cleavage/methylation domain-containing protein